MIDVLRADGGGWTSVPAGRGSGGAAAPLRRPHPPVLRAGRLRRPGHPRLRDDLRAAWRSDPDLRRRTRQAHLALPPSGARRARRVLGLLERCVSGGRLPDDDEAARVLRVVTAVEVRDAALFAVTGDDAVAHLDLWSSLLRRASDAPGARHRRGDGLLRLAGGHGALAWCALDRCFEVDPDHSLGLALAECLVRAVPPTALGGRWTSAQMPSPALPERGRARPKVTAWEKTSTPKSSPALTARATARRSTGASTCSSGCSASRSSTPTTR